ncbi:PPC domain-containing DNA-binding protein [Rhodocytophaga rosea]|nr:PPC domain-containing DNA-binding protein [Rhodocytophaga rosea]
MSQVTPSSSMQVYALRLKPGQDLKTELQNFITGHKIEAAAIITCVGSLQKATLRLANQSEYQTYEQKMEIVSLVGTLAVEGSHVHISLSDSSGTTIGGHLVEGCLVYTTAEIILGVLPDLRFARELDEASGYKELKVYSRKRKNNNKF